MITSVTVAFDRHGTDKGSTYHNYGRQYEDLMRPYQDKPIRFLEIGVFKGKSMPAWRDAFPNAQVIVGVDIDPECSVYSNADKGIVVLIGDATDPDTVNRINSTYGPFDIIVDDGRHTNRAMIESFEKFFPLLADGGLYIVEDTDVWNDPEHNVPEYPNVLSYFANLTPFLNQGRVNSDQKFIDFCSDPFKSMKKTSNPFEYSVDKIQFGCSFIAINKLIRKHWIV